MNIFPAILKNRTDDLMFQNIILQPNILSQNNNSQHSATALKDAIPGLKLMVIVNNKKKNQIRNTQIN